MAVSQKDIALRVGVDRSLVAHALRGDPRVSEATRQKVLAAALELGYDANVNVAARSLAAKRHGKRTQTNTLAVLVGDFVDGLPLQDLPFFREILQGIHLEAARRGFDVAIHVLRVGQLPRSLQSGGVDGAISVYSRAISAAIEAQEPVVPVVNLGSESAKWNLRPDDCGGTRKMTEHLLQLGHRRIAYFGAYNGSNAERQRGYEEALAEAGLPLRPELMPMLDAASVRCGQEGWQAFCAQHSVPGDCTAVVCINDAVAVGVLHAAQQMGLGVPEDLSVTGFDGLRDGYGGCPILTTAAFDRRDMGRRAVRILCDVQDGNQAELPREILPVRLWKRGSTAVPTANN
jgi:LacI family transcriptional regulator